MAQSQTLVKASGLTFTLRVNMTTIHFQDAEEDEIIETINKIKIIVPRYCAEYGIEFPTRIPDEWLQNPHL